MKYLALIDVNPETKHKTSSGKNGNKNIKVKRILSLPSISFSPFFMAFSPNSHTTTFKPKNLPVTKATIEPSIIPIQLYIAPKNGPKSSTPAPTVITDGIGKITTCKNCIKTNKRTAKTPKDCI